MVEKHASIGATPIAPRHRASCHCGAVVLELDLPDGVVDARRCNCSMCRRKGYIAASVPLDGLHLIRGKGVLGLYQFNTGTAEHYFCSRCGIHTHHKRRSTPGEFSYNVACLDGVDPFDIPSVREIDGVNHPSDR